MWTVTLQCQYAVAEGKQEQIHNLSPAENQVCLEQMRQMKWLEGRKAEPQVCRRQSRHGKEKH